MKEPMQELNQFLDCGHAKVFRDRELVCLVCAKEQHSADLREIAEMAIAESEKYWKAYQGYWEYALPKPTEITADSIVREFREKKAKVGK